MDTVVVFDSISDGELRDNVWLALIDIVSVNVFVISAVGVGRTVTVIDWVVVKVTEPPPRRRWFVAVSENELLVLMVQVPVTVTERESSKERDVEPEGCRERDFPFVTVKVMFSLRVRDGGAESESDGDAVFGSVNDLVPFDEDRVVVGWLESDVEKLGVSLVSSVSVIFANVIVSDFDATS